MHTDQTQNSLNEGPGSNPNHHVPLHCSTILFTLVKQNHFDSLTLNEIKSTRNTKQVEINKLETQREVECTKGGDAPHWILLHNFNGTKEAEGSDHAHRREKYENAFTTEGQTQKD